MTKLYLMLGYPGAGKTTTAKIISELTGAEHISSDETRLKMFPHPSFSEAEHSQLYHILDKRTEESLKSGKDVIYDANLNRYRHRKEKYDICARNGVQPVLLWVQTPKELAKARATGPHRANLVPSNESPQDMFERIAHVIEPPHPNEPYIGLDGTKISAEYLSRELGMG